MPLLLLLSLLALLLVLLRVLLLALFVPFTLRAPLCELAPPLFLLLLRPPPPLLEMERLEADVVVVIGDGGGETAGEDTGVDAPLLKDRCPRSSPLSLP